MAITSFPINTKTFEELDVITDAQATDADGVMFFDESVGVMKRMTRGELFKGKVIPLDSIVVFPSLDVSGYSDRQQFHLNSFAPNGATGGGPLLWGPGLPKSLHDGVRYFSPTVPIPADFDNPTDVQNYMDGIGEEFPTADGVFVLTLFSIQSSESPTINNALVQFDGVSGNTVKNGPVPSLIGTALIQAPNITEVSYHRLNADETVTARTTAEHKTDLSLNEVDNTSDADKPISNDTQDALDLKANTDDVDDALALKAPLASPALTGTPTAPTAAANTNTTQLATTAYVQGELTDRIQSVATIADLRALTPTAVGQKVSINGHTNSGIGDGEFVAIAGATTDNNGTLIDSGSAAYHWQRIGFETPTLEMFGGGLGGNDQSAWLALYAAYSSCQLLARDYLVDNFNITKAFTLKTKGFRSRLVQNTGVTGTNQQISVITVAAAGVTIEDIALNGTIATDTGEDRHGIRVDATTVPGGISGIHIGNVNAANMRGDAVVLTGAPTRQVNNFSVGDVFGFNIYRNGLSLVSGINGTIGFVSVAQEGLFAFDSEPDSGGGIVENVTIAGVWGRHCGVPAVTSVQKRIVFGVVDIDTSRPQSTPVFSPLQESESNGLVFRSTRGCHIQECIIRGTDEAAIRVFKEVADEYVDNISFGNLTIESCLGVGAVDVSLIRSSGSKNWHVYGTLKYTLSDPDTQELILDGADTGLVRLHCGRIEGNGPLGRSVQVNARSSNISYTADKACITFNGNCVFNDAVWNVGIVAAFSFGTISFTGSNLTWTGSFKYAGGNGTNFHSYETNTYASPTVGATPTWAATRVDV